MKKIIKFNNLVLLMVFGLHASNCRDTTPCSFKKGCFGAAVGAALVGAAAAAANYFFKPTDQQQYDSAVILYNQLRAKYSSLLDSFVDFLGIKNLSFYEKQRVLKSCNEEFLNQVGWAMWKNGVSVSSFPQKISQDAVAFDNCLRDLTNRVNDLKSKQYPSSVEINLMNTIDGFLSSISHSSELLLLFAEYCKKYETYFEISDFGWFLYAEYEPELTVIERYRYDLHSLMIALHDIIVRKQNINCYGADCNYPYVRYVEYLDNSLCKVEKMRNNLLFIYPARVGWIDTVLMPQLRWLRATLDPYYQSEILYRRRIQLDEEIQLLRHRHASHEIARLEDIRAEIEDEYRNTTNQLVIHIH